MAAERLLQYGQATRLRRKPFDGADVGAVGLHRERQAGAGRHAVNFDRAGAAHAVLAADMGAGHRQIVTQEIGQQHARLGIGLYRAAIELKPNAVARVGAQARHRRASSIVGPTKLADEIAAITRGRVQIVARVELPGKCVERVVERVAVESGKSRARRAVGDAADREPHAVRRAPPPRRPRWRNRRGDGRIRGTRSRAPGARHGASTASISSSSLRAVDIMPVKKSSAGTRRCFLPRRQLDGAFEREQDQRQFGARIGVRDRAADRAAAAGLRVPDPRQRRGQQRLAFAKFGPCQKLRLPYAGADADGIRVDFDFRRVPADA